jgi:hypothetical protein
MYRSKTNEHVIQVLMKIQPAAPALIADELNKIHGAGTYNRKKVANALLRMMEGNEPKVTKNDFGYSVVANRNSAPMKAQALTLPIRTRTFPTDEEWKAMTDAEKDVIIDYYAKPCED